MLPARKVVVPAALALASLLLVAGPAAAEAKSFTITATSSDDFTENWFEVEGLTGRNPDLELAPGDEVTVTLKVGKGSHNLRIGPPVDAESAYVDPGNEQVASFSFTVPESAKGTIDYWCVPHKGLGMAGKIKVLGTTGGDETKKTPGFEGLLAALALAGAVAVLGRRVRT